MTNAVDARRFPAPLKTLIRVLFRRQMSSTETHVPSRRRKFFTRHSVKHLNTRDCNTGIPNTEEFGTVIEDDDTNADSEKELSLEQKLELAIAKKVSKNQNTIHKSAIFKSIRRAIYSYN
ncbi:UNVERIFIED_CONTAM: hypothetical protein NCL1_12504 [Trichonephila clavipes]